jgi:hypothetical protein
MALGREPMRVTVRPRAVRSGVGSGVGYSACVDCVGLVEKVCLVTRVYGLTGTGPAARMSLVESVDGTVDDGSAPAVEELSIGTDADYSSTGYKKYAPALSGGIGGPGIRVKWDIVGTGGPTADIECWLLAAIWEHRGMEAGYFARVLDVPVNLVEPRYAIWRRHGR